MTGQTQQSGTSSDFAPMVRSAVVSGEIAGAVASYQTRSAVRMEGYGWRDLASASPVQVDTIFRIGSCAKALFATAALRLIEDRQLDLERPVVEWIPELASRAVLRTPTSEIDDVVPARREITLRDVLTFQLGIGVYLHPQDTPIYRAMRAAEVAPQREPVPFGPDEFAERLGRLPLAHQPGETFLYHVGDDVVRILIGRMTGEPLEDVLQERVFQPLSMVDTGCSVPSSKLHRFSTCYFSRKEPEAPLQPWDLPQGRFAQVPTFPNQLMSTAVDLSRFATMMLDDGLVAGRPFLKPETIAMMTRDQLTDAQKALSPAPPGFWETRGWGIGATVYARDVPAGPRAGSYSWFGGYGPHFVIDRQSGAAVTLMVPRVVEQYTDTQLGYDFELATYRDFIG